MRRNVCVWIGGLLLLGCSMSAGAQENPYEKNIYEWDGGDGRNVVIVPPSRLRNALSGVNGETPHTLGVMPDQWEFFVRQLTASHRSGRKGCIVSSASGPYGCYVDPSIPGMIPEPGSRTAMGPIRAQPTAIVGIVTAEVPNWHFTGSVVVVVFLQIVEILKDESASLGVGDLVTLLVPWGELKIGPYSLCSHQPEGVLEFEQGDLFIVTGHIDEWNDHHIATSDGFYFKLVDGVVTYPPRHVSFRADPSLTWARVRRELQIE